MGTHIYEAAAGAAFLTENVIFYVECQTHLLELYGQMKNASLYSRRIEEFLGYALLYFGVLANGEERVLDVTIMARKHGCLRSSHMRFAMDTLKAFRKRHDMRFISMWKACSKHLKVLLKDVAPELRKRASLKMIKTNHEMSRDDTARALGLDTSRDAFKLLRIVRPDLATLNEEDGPAFIFNPR